MYEPFMIKVSSPGKKGILQLTQNENYEVYKTEGFAALNTNIMQTENVYIDGGKCNLTHVEPRNIVLYIHFRAAAVESSRLTLYPYFAPHQELTIEYANDNRSGKISGFVESIECDLFNNPQFMQISIICPYPFFSSSVYTKLILSSAATGTLNNAGDIDAGITTDITVDEMDGYSPILQNLTTGQKMIINTKLEVGKTLKLSSLPGEKTVKILSTGGETQNVISKMDISSRWITMLLGGNELKVSTANGAACTAIIKMHHLYVGM